MKKWTMVLIAILALALMAGCAGSKKGGALEKGGAGGAGPKMTADGAVFSFQAPTGTVAVYLAGEFNGW
ncbi:hypothetical protein KAU04_03745, partial [bacterium]|nr:hypothetical protein [bacterium]